MTTYSAYYVNSKRDEAQDVINRLNAVGGLEVNYLAPPADLSLAGIRPDTQLFLVEWELDQHSDGIKVDYKGGTFARRLRDKFFYTPIALTSDKGQSRWGRVDSYLFDAEFLKEEMDSQPKHVVQTCLSLITGYQKLEEADKTWTGLMDVLEAGTDEEILRKIGEAAPPLLKRDGHTTWQVSDMAKWIQDVLLAYPGILYDPLHAATYLGIDVSEFVKPDVQALFQEARYTGVLAPAEGRWWRDRLHSAATGLIFESGSSRLSVNTLFAKAFAQLHGRELQLAECVYSQRKPAQWVCYVLKKPVRIEYSLAYLPDNRPLVMDGARVSFTAIRTNDNVFDEYFDAASRYLLDDIRGGVNNEL